MYRLGREWVKGFAQQAQYFIGSGLRSGIKHQPTMNGINPDKALALYGKGPGQQNVHGLFFELLHLLATWPVSLLGLDFLGTLAGKLVNHRSGQQFFFTLGAQQDLLFNLYCQWKAFSRGNPADTGFVLATNRMKLLLFQSAYKCFGAKIPLRMQTEKSQVFKPHTLPLY